MDKLNFYKYINDKSMLVINQNGEIKRIYCPFVVKDIKRVISTVTSIATGKDEFPYYFIAGHYYKYSFYSILS